jgi:hypothetical protein
VPLLLLVLLFVNAACKGSSSTAAPTTTTPTTPTTPPVTLSGTVLAFPNFGPAGATQTVTLTNTGTALLNIASIGVTGNYTQTNDCGASVDLGVLCTITVTFNPQVVGTGGTLTITDDATTSPHTVAITGPNVVSPTGVVSPNTLTFSGRAVGSVSPMQIVTLSNPVNGISAPLTIVSTQVTGDFSVTQKTCGSALAAGASCTFSLTFAPTGAGARAGTFVIVDNAPQLAQSVALSGVGQ